MVRRWFGPRPIYNDPVYRHGSCGCCGCGGFNADDVAIRYAAYPNGLRIKLTIEDVPDGFTCSIDGGYPIYITEASGMSQYNGTYYLDIIRSQYGCIFSANDFAEFDVAYNMSDPDFDYDINYTQRVRIGSRVTRTTPFLARVFASIGQFSPDYYDNVVLSGEAYGTFIHPMIGLAFEPTDPDDYSAQGFDTDLISGATIEEKYAGWFVERLNNVVSGNLRFYLTSAIADQFPMVPDFTASEWDGISTFWDTGTSDFKVAGTFTAEIERL
jgi:hypothetical protein